MTYLGDFAEDATVRFGWNTNAVAGESITRATDGTVSVYKNGGVSQTTTGVTDTEDFDALTGVHLCTIDTSADPFYAAGADYMVVLSGATIDGKAVNAVLAHFSIANRAGSAPTAAEVADAVWDEELSGHTSSDTAGRRLGLGIPDATAGAAGGLWILGANAAAATTLTGTAGNPALTLTGGSNSHGMSLVGNGTGAGLSATGGDLGSGASLTGGSLTGSGLAIDGVTGLSVNGSPSAPAISVTGAADGLSIVTTGGRPVYLDAGADDQPAIFAQGGSGGSTGHGLRLRRGHANADDLHLSTPDAPTLAAAILPSMFTLDTGQTYATAAAGSVVKETADNASGGGAASDPLESQVPGSYASGTAGHRLGMLGGVKVTVVSPVADTGELTLVRGDAYTSRLGRALTFTDARDTWPDLTDGVVTLEVGDGLVVATGVVVTATGAGKTVRVDVRSSETDLLTQDRYDYNLVVTYPGTGTTAADGGDRATLVSAEVVAVDREDA